MTFIAGLLGEFKIIPEISVTRECGIEYIPSLSGNGNVYFLMSMKQDYAIDQMGNISK